LEGISETEPPDEDPEVGSGVHLQCPFGQGPLGDGVQAAHEELVVERDLGDYGLRIREKPPAA